MDAAAFQRRIEEGIRGLGFKSAPARLYDPVRYMLDLGGKRMRPVMTLMGCDLFGGDIEQAVNPALGVELFHNFTLLHDDIMDHAPLRRGRPTVHEKWDTSTAILAGDVMFVRSYQLVSLCPDHCIRAVTKLFSDTAIEVCEGQQYDLDYESLEVSMEDYLTMITLKTSVLPATALKTGAIIAGAPDKDAALLYDAGKHIGIAFQVMDDVLDVFGDAGKFGKQPGGDILAGKKTGVLIRALETAGAGDRDALLRLYADKDMEPEKKVSSVTRLFGDLGVRESLQQEMNRHFDTAVQSLDAINAPAEKKEAMKAFFGQLMKREM